MIALMFTILDLRSGSVDTFLMYSIELNVAGARRVDPAGLAGSGRTDVWVSDGAYHLDLSCLLLAWPASVDPLGLCPFIFL